VASGLATVSPIVAGLLVKNVSSLWAMGLFAALLGVSTVLAVTLKGIRRAEAASV
jgi:hypothetical protein